MRAETPQVVPALVSEEIRRIVADAVADGMCISLSASAARIFRTYPNCGMDEREIVGEIVSAASAAGVAIDDDLPPYEVHEGDGADGANFGALFAQSEAVYGTLNGIFSTTRAPVDSEEMIEKLVEQIPGLELTTSDLRLAVVQVAKVAGVPVKVDKRRRDRSENTDRQKREISGSV